MSNKYIESELCDLCEDALDKLDEDGYKKMILATIDLVLNLKLPPGAIEWDMLAEREKFEPADTN